MGTRETGTSPDDPTQANPTRYEWNAAHRLSKVILPDLTSAEHRYNGDELRTWRREPLGAETNYDWVPSGILGLSQVLNETDGTGFPKANYVLGPNGLIALVDGDGHERYYVFDALGSVLALTDETGAVTDAYAYDEYGVAPSTTSSTSDLIRYAGQRLDSETVTYYLRARSYSPKEGMFLSRDPLGPTLPGYLYANDNPINLTDPSGLRCQAGWSRQDYEYKTAFWGRRRGLNVTIRATCCCPPNSTPVGAEVSSAPSAEEFFSSIVSGGFYDRWRTNGQEPSYAAFIWYWNSPGPAPLIRGFRGGCMCCDPDRGVVPGDWIWGDAIFSEFDVWA